MCLWNPVGWFRTPFSVPGSTSFHLGCYCLTIVAIDLGCNVADNAISDERRAHYLSDCCLSANPTPVRGLNDFHFDNSGI